MAAYNSTNTHLGLLCANWQNGWQSPKRSLLLGFFSKGQDPPDNAKTFETCKLVIEYDMRAVYWMVRHYQYSKNIAKDFAGVPQRLEEAAELEETEAIYYIARCHILGLGTAKNMMRAVGCYKFAAQQNHAVAQYELGRCYENGTWVKKNICDAIELYKKAADQNYIPALKTLAAFYESDDYQMKDLNQTFQYHKRAAEQDDADEQIHIAECYINGSVVTKSDEDALYWYEKAAVNGKTEGYTSIAECYEKSIGTRANFLNACTAYQADDFSVQMQQLLLDIIERNRNADSTDFNPEQAFKVYLKLTKLYPNDVNWGRLAEYYQNGIGKPADFEKLYRRFLQKPRAQQREETLQFLAQQCESGCAPNASIALEMYEKIAELLPTEANMLKLAWCYENGVGQPISLDMAFKVYQQLASIFRTAGNQIKVAKMLENGIGVKAGIEEAIQYYLEARAFARLGDLYCQGEKVAKSLLRAGEYYVQAEELNTQQLKTLFRAMSVFPRLRKDGLKYFHVARCIAYILQRESLKFEIPIE